MYVVLVQDELIGDYVVYRVAKSWEEAVKAAREAVNRYYHVVIELQGDAL